MLRNGRMAFAALALLLLTGCWDYKEIHQITYITVIGVDYENGQFVVSAQSQNFANIAQREGSRPPIHHAVVGTARADTVTQAMFNLYRSGQQYIYWGHISALVFGRRVLEKLTIEQLVDLINRFHELRYNVWVFGTDSPIKKILDIEPNFGYSSYDSRLMKPDQPYRQYSNIKPIYLNKFVSAGFERGESVALPKLGIDASAWTEGGKQTPELKLDGVYVFSPRKYRGGLTDEEVVGKRYVDPDSKRMPLVVYKDGKPAVGFVIHTPKVHVRHEVQGGKLICDVSIATAGYIDEMQQDVTAEYMKQEVRRQIEEEVRRTFEAGKKLNVDVLNLTTPLYRHHYSTWNRLFRGEMDMAPVELRRIVVRFDVQFSGKYKARLE